MITTQRYLNDFHNYILVQAKSVLFLSRMSPSTFCYASFYIVTFLHSKIDNLARSPEKKIAIKSILVIALHFLAEVGSTSNGRYTTEGLLIIDYRANFVAQGVEHIVKM